MKNLLLLLVLIFITCGKDDELKEEFLTEDLQIGVWEVEGVLIQKGNNFINLSNKIEDCETVDTFIVTSLNDK